MKHLSFRLFTFLLTALTLFTASAANRRSTSANSFASSAEYRNAIRVNAEVTTHIVMPENLKLVDISTEKIIGNQCTDNIVRIKPLPEDSTEQVNYHNNEFLGTITLIGERHIAQYDVIYDSSARNAVSIFNVQYDQLQDYSNPEVAMPHSEMAKFAWAIYGSKRKFNTIRTKANGIKAEIYNIYSIGNFFFIDFVLENKTNIDYDIEEIRVTLNDKKETKATNSQMVQLSPVYTLNPASNFRKKYRQVLVLDKLTFPEEKVVNIAISEKQISGRTVTLTIDYNDILNADGFDISKVEKMKTIYKYVEVEKKKKSDADAVSYQNIKKENVSLNNQLTAANKEIESLRKARNSDVEIVEKENCRLEVELEAAHTEIGKLKAKVKNLSTSLDKMEAAYNGAKDTIDRILSKDNNK